MTTPARAAGPGRGSRQRPAAGSRRALSRLLTAIESRTPAAEEALRALYPVAGGAHVVGITGPPGGGKSTLVAALVAEARAADRPVAVLAIDPSSPVTGGAILGDRIRMQQYAGDRDVFIRSMASRGHLGGLAGTTAESAAVLDACGFGLVFIETVGTGQSEVEVASIADTTVVVQAPGDGRRDPGHEGRACWRWPTSSSSTRPTDPVPTAPPRSCARCSRWGTRPGRHRPTRPGPGPSDPQVLLASGLDGGRRARAAGRARRAPRRRAACRRPHAARIARARAQVEGILADRTREALWSTEAARRHRCAHGAGRRARARPLRRCRRCSWSSSGRARQPCATM